MPLIMPSCFLHALRGLLLAVVLSCAFLAPAVAGDASEPGRHTFTIGDEAFQLDGKPFVIRCGEIHFPRIPRAYWRHRLQMCKALGLNTVCVYLFWNFHEWQEGTYDWAGQADVAEFCRLAQAEGLWVLLRPGPYSCAEWEMGGLPWWLVQRDKIDLRSRDPAFMQPAVRYLKEVGRVLAPLQITRGGPLLMVQVENEYGSFGKDAEYMGALRQALIDGGFEVPLFACNPTGAIRNGLRDDLFQVANFGQGGAAKAFEALRQVQKTGPLMNGEYYPAWFDTWGQPHKTGDIKAIVGDLDFMLGKQASFSLYMAHGGTTFGLWSGANRPYKPETSSYDYEAPISEAGWVTPKFTAIRELFAKHLQPGETLPEPPSPNPVIAIPPVTLTACAPVFSNLPVSRSAPVPPNMETYNQGRGCIAYRTELPAGPAGVLVAQAVHDFAWVQLDGKPVGVIDRRMSRFSLRLPARSAPARLDILVEAMGRINFGREMYDRKGLIAPVTFKPQDGEPQEIRGWEVFSLPLDQQQLAGLHYVQATVPLPPGASRPAFWRGTLHIAQPGDTFLDLRTWGKGVVWINGHCLARFWDIGPTQTAYVPGPWLQAGDNEVVVLDLVGPREPVLAGLTKPILDQLRPELDFSLSRRATGQPVLTQPVASGAFTADAAWQTATLAKPASGRYLAFEALSAHDGGDMATMAEFEVLGATGQVLPNATWKVIWVDNEDRENVGEVDNILDGQPNTCWKTVAGHAAAPHRFIIDFGASQPLGAVRYLARGGNAKAPGRIKEWRLYVADQPFGVMPPP